MWRLSETNRFADTAGLKDKMCFLSFFSLSFFVYLSCLPCSCFENDLLSLSLLLSRKKSIHRSLFWLNFWSCLIWGRKGGLVSPMVEIQRDRTIGPPLKNRDGSKRKREKETHGIKGAHKETVLHLIKYWSRQSIKDWRKKCITKPSYAICILLS